jgi:hypothetical protein
MFFRRLSGNIDTQYDAPEGEMQHAQCATMPDELAECFHGVGLSAGILRSARAESSDFGQVNEEISDAV